VGEVVNVREQAAAFEALLALDPSYEARQELRREGIAESAIEALYPTDFDTLAPFLMIQLIGAETSRLRDLRTGVTEVDSIVYASNVTATATSYIHTLMNPRHVEAYKQAHDHSAPLWELNKYFLDCFPGTAASNAGAALDASRVIWLTHWFMLHRSELLLNDQRTADNLMLRLSRAIGLNVTVTS
jgi:hypothetical protein